MTISKDGLQPIGEFVQHLRSSDRHHFTRLDQSNALFEVRED